MKNTNPAQTYLKYGTTLTYKSTLHTHTHTHTRLTALFPGLPRWDGTRKVKAIWISLKQETVSGSGISWAICKSAPSSRQITMPVPHHSSFLQAGCPFCHPTNSVKALKAIINLHYSKPNSWNLHNNIPANITLMSSQYRFASCCRPSLLCSGIPNMLYFM